MKNWPYFLIFMAIIGIVIYLLYRLGFVVAKGVAAAVFIFRRRKNGEGGTLVSCTGYLRHIVRLRESRTYVFYLDAQLSKGNVEVTLLDGDKEPLLTLNPEFPSKEINLDGNSRYYLQWKFQHTTGKCELIW